MESVASASNLARALLNVLRNKGAPGVDGRSVEQVVDEAPALLPELQKSLLEGTYRPGDIRRVWIPKPGGGERGLGIPNVVDRWVQQAVLQVLEPIFEPRFHRSSHGFRANRGAHTAIAEAKQYLGEGYRVLVDLDLSKFFDRVHHQRLLNRLGQQVGDDRILNLVQRMLKAKVVLPDGAKASTEEGTPQGGPMTPRTQKVTSTLSGGWDSDESRVRIDGWRIGLYVYDRCRVPAMLRRPSASIAHGLCFATGTSYPMRSSDLRRNVPYLPVKPIVISNKLGI
jgi:RNA-directed DNA polymerase